jgi:hypothetical protein
MYYGWNTAKFGMAVGIVFAVVTVTERISRWAFRAIRNTVEYWRDEYRDIRYKGNDPDLMDLENDPFVNDSDGWESPVIEKRMS